MDTEPLWVRVGGGMESVPGHRRHGPADVEFPPPGGPWEPLLLNGKLVGWATQGGLRMARKSAEMGQRLVDEQRDHLLGRLGHKLRSSVLALQESARQAAFGRPELLEAVFEQAQEVGRRAAGLEAAAIEPKDSARGVVFGAVLNLAVPAAAHQVPSDAAVIGSEPALVEALTRIRDWLVGDALNRRLAGRTVGVVLVTHSHPDHLPLAERFAAPHRASVRRYPELGDGDIVRVATLNITALYTPGHSSDHLCFLIPGDGAVFTGDLILGQGSSMVTYPEGDVAAYLRSLDRLADLKPLILFPGHWDPVKDAMEKIDEYRRHRLEREAQILAEVRRGGGTADGLTRRVYGVLDEKLMVAAEMTLRAHLRKLVDDGSVHEEDEVYTAVGTVGR